MSKDSDDLEISNINPGEREIQIVHPKTREKLGISILVMSVDDPRMKRHTRKLMDKRSERQRKNKILSAEEMEAGIIELVAHAVVDWNWGERKYKGDVPQYSHRKVLEVFSDENISWLFDQVNEEVGETKAFF